MKRDPGHSRPPGKVPVQDPPALATRFLRHFGATTLLEVTEGDLAELFAMRAEKGRMRAKLWYWNEVLLFCIWHPRSTPERSLAGSGTMYRNYLNVAWRNMRKQAGYTVINVCGLALGIACALLITLFVRHELSYDDFHPDADRLYRIVQDVHLEGGSGRQDARVEPALLPWLETDVAGIEKVARLFSYEVLSGALVSRDGDQHFQEHDFYFADSTFLDLFGYELIEGDRSTALDVPLAVLITESTARKYFGEQSSLGQTLLFRNDDAEYTFTVTGVLRDLPDNSHVHFDFLASFSSLRGIDSWLEHTYYWAPTYLYVRLRPGVDPFAVADEVSTLVGARLDNQRGCCYVYELQAVGDIHLTSNRENEAAPNSNASYVYILIVIAASLLVIACVNFMNLATARSASREREVGIRKVLGARRGQLVRQFLAESFVMTILGLVLAIALIPFLLPLFNDVSGLELRFENVLSRPMLLWIGVLLLGIALVAGSYPALYLSAFRPVQSARPAAHRGWSGAVGFRKGLVVFQFAVSSILLVGTGVIYQQLRFIQNKNLGFDVEQVVVIRLRDAVDQQNYKALKEDLLQDPVVLAASGSGSVPGMDGLYDFRIFPAEAAVDSVEILNLVVDHDFTEVFGLELVAGRDFSEDYPSDINEGFIVNESLAASLGWDEPVGKELAVDFHLHGEYRKSGHVVGVVRDFNFRSLHNAVAPLLMHVVPPSYYTDFLSVRLAPGNVSESMARLESSWQRFSPGRPFEFTFLDGHFDALYRSERRLSKLVGYFALLTVVIASMGLFGLASFAAAQRTKEIGVRKVLGASVAGITVMLARDFVGLVIGAFVLAMPVAFVLTRSWLEDFAYHINPQPGLFIAAATLATFIAIASVSYQSIRAALANPVDALRYE